MLILLGQCLLCNNQSQQRSGHANQPQKKKYYVLACGLVSHARFAFLLNTITFPGLIVKQCGISGWHYGLTNSNVSLESL